MKSGNRRTTKKPPARSRATRTGRSEPSPEAKAGARTSLLQLTSQGLARLRSRLGAGPANEPGQTSAAKARNKKVILDALARLEADYERVLKPD
jgi:hypothetical protein